MKCPDCNYTFTDFYTKKEKLICLNCGKEEKIRSSYRKAERK